MSRRSRWLMFVNLYVVMSMLVTPLATLAAPPAGDVSAPASAPQTEASSPAPSRDGVPVNDPPDVQPLVRVRQSGATNVSGWWAVSNIQLTVQTDAGASFYPGQVGVVTIRVTLHRRLPTAPPSR